MRVTNLILVTLIFYINYEGTSIDIDTTDYTFEFSDNGDGTYSYNARFVTSDGRIIEFAGVLPTTVC